MRLMLIACASSIAAAAPAAAASYFAMPVAPTSERFITRDIVWRCGGAACQGSSEDSRPAVLCQSIARNAGRLSSFMVDGRAFAAAELERCNAAAKAAPRA